jgi:hypothetical protein
MTQNPNDIPQQSIYGRENIKPIRDISIREFNPQYYESIEEESDKRNYLGEIIFKKIENHPINHQYNLTNDVISRMTGMFLGIADINEVIDIVTNDEILSSRIIEALDLLKSKGEI